VKINIPWKSFGIIAALGLIVYANSLNGAFIWDDEYLVRDNAYIKSWGNLPRIFTEDIGAGVGHRFTFYRPLQMLSYMLDHSLWGLNVRGYHLTNVVFHVLAAWAVFGLIMALYKEERLALWTGILFVIHPVHTEAVCYISSRADPMFAFFLLLTAVFYIKNLDSKCLISCFGMAAAYACALLSKEMAVILPGLLLLYHYAFGRRISWKPFLTLVTLAGLYVVSRMTVFNFAMEDPQQASSLVQRLPGFFAALAGYFRLILLPFNLHMEYGKALFRLSDPTAVAGVLIFLLLLSYLYKKRNERGLVFFGLAWFLLALLPVSNLFPINAFMAEHWLYLPAIGLFLIAAKGLDNLYKNEGLSYFYIAVAIGVVAFYSGITVMQNHYWNDPITFYGRSLGYAPKSVRMHNGLALAYYEAGDQDKAISTYKDAVKALPDSASMYNNLGALYMATGKGAPARESFLRAIELDQDYGEPYGNLAIYHFRNKEYILAIEYYDKASRRGVVNPELQKDLQPHRVK